MIFTKEIMLTEHQNKILKGVLEAIKTNKYVVLNGSAGTGKTTVMKEFIKQLKKTGQRYTLNATTHEAARQLESKVNEQVGTIHKLHGLVPRYKRDAKSTYLIRSKGNSSIPKTRAIHIIDEASMIGTELLSFIQEDTKGKYLFIGDDKQLPPVEDNNQDCVSPIFQMGFPTFTLEEIHRQAKENDNIKLSMNLDLLNSGEDGEYYEWILNQEIFNIIEQYDATYLAFRNIHVDRINKEYREYLGITDPYVTGEEVILQAPIAGYTNGERVKIFSIKEETYKKFGLNINCWLINYKIRIPKDYYGQKQVTDKLKSFAGIKDWNNFYPLKDDFTTVKHSYAMTIHKSQGSTFDNTILNVSDAMNCRNVKLRNKLLYTGVTRTQNKNFLI